MAFVKNIWVTCILASFSLAACSTKPNETDTTRRIHATNGNGVSGENVPTMMDYSYLYENLAFEMPILQTPVFPDHTVCITDFGGIPDGVTINTEAFEKAMQSLAEKGGGTLVVPDGIWFTGPIVLRSNINLYLKKGALLLFSPDINLYPVDEIVFEGRKTIKCQSPISGKKLENIAITGKGAINGSGEAWRPLKKIKVTEHHWKEVVASGGVVKDNIWYPTDKHPLNPSILNHWNDRTADGKTRIRETLRPTMIHFVQCKNILLEGVLFDNSPAWDIHPLMCENLIVDNITVRNPYYAQNGDGIDLESCKNTLVVNSSFDVGDDAICIKSGKDEEGRRRGIPTENMIVNNCRVHHGHGGFVVGSEMSGGVKNISVTNCQFLGTDVGLRFKSTRGRGGVVENIYIDHITMHNILHEPLLFDLYYFVKERSPNEAIPEADITTPVFRNIYIKEIVSNGGNKAMFFNGLPEMNIENVHVENAVIAARLGAELSEAQHITFKNVTVIPDEGPALILHNVKDTKIEQFTSADTLKTIVQITGERNRHIVLPDDMDRSKIAQ